MNKTKMFNIVLTILVILLVIFNLYFFVFSVTMKPEKFENGNVSRELNYTIDSTENEIICTKLINYNSFLKNMIENIVPKTVTTYTFENNEITSVIVKYYYAREIIAKYDFEHNNIEEDFFENQKTISNNVVTQDLTDIYNGMTKEEILNNIKTNYSI